jgi:hypothetical protein
MTRVSSSALAKHDLETFGYSHLAPELLDPSRSGCTERQVEEFIGSWNDLPPDPYISGSSAASRLRRYGRIAVLEKGITALPPAPFVQSNDINSVFGGIERQFAALEPAVVASPVLSSLIRMLRQCLPALPDRTEPMELGIHQIRVQASAGADGLPTPEGIHQDGHCFVAQVFILRNDVDGGRSSFYESGTAVYHTYLNQPFECLLVDDRRMHHGVSAIKPAGTSHGWRDMLLIDFPELSTSAAAAGVRGDEHAAWSLTP